MRAAGVVVGVVRAFFRWSDGPERGGGHRTIALRRGMTLGHGPLEKKYFFLKIPFGQGRDSRSKPVVVVVVLLLLLLLLLLLQSSAHRMGGPTCTRPGRSPRRTPGTKKISTWEKLFQFSKFSKNLSRPQTNFQRSIEIRSQICKRGGE